MSSSPTQTLLQKVRQHGFPLLTLERLHRLYQAAPDPLTVNIRRDVARYCHALARAGDAIWHLAAYERLFPLESVLAQDVTKASSPLAGIPVAIKANLAVAALPLTAGSRILAGNNKEEPDNIGYDADVTAILLQDCGALFMGTTTMDEFGMGSWGTHMADSAKQPRNPIPLLQHRHALAFWTDADIRQLVQLPEEAIFDLHEQVLQDYSTGTRTTEHAAEELHYAPGGSSCGSAIAVAHGSAIVALGSDTGGSIRLPATYCQTVGFKPAYGRLSRHGLVSYASSLDTIGILASTVTGVATTYQCLLQNQGGSERPMRDSTQTTTVASEYRVGMAPSAQRSNESEVAESSVPPPLESLGGGATSIPSLQGLRIGIPAAFSVAECSPAVRQVWLHGAQWLQQHGAVVEPVSIQHIAPKILQKSLSAYYILACAEASSNLSRYDGLRFGATAVVPEEASQNTLLEQQYAATRTEFFGNEVIRRILCGTFVLSSDRFHTHYEMAAKLRATLSQQFQDTFRDICSIPNDDGSSEKYDLLLIPTTIYPPPKLTSKVNPTEMFANDIMTVPISLVGYPAISVSIRGSHWGDHSHDPAFQIGLQLVGPRQGEPNVLRAAAVLEQLDCSARLCRQQ